MIADVDWRFMYGVTIGTATLTGVFSTDTLTLMAYCPAEAINGRKAGWRNRFELNLV